MKIAEVRKLGVAVAGALTEALAAGLIPPAEAKWVEVGLALASAVGVYAVKNAPQAATK